MRRKRIQRTLCLAALVTLLLAGSVLTYAAEAEPTMTVTAETTDEPTASDPDDDDDAADTPESSDPDDDDDDEEATVTPAASGSTPTIKKEVLEGKTAGVLTGTPQGDIIQNNIKNVELQQFNVFTDMALALQQNKIDFYINSTVSYRISQASYPDFAYIDDPLVSLNISSIFPKTEKGQALCEEFNAYIEKIKADGTLKNLQDYWLYPNNWQNVDIPREGARGTIKLATCTSNKPYAMMLNNEYAGFDIAIIAGFCTDSGYGLTIDDTDFAGMLSGVTSGKYDIAASQISWTAERAEQVLYGETYYTQELVAIVRAADYGLKADTADGGSFLARVARSFERTFITEGRYKLILKGLLITLIITAGGFLLANLMGMLLCAMAMSRHAVLRVIADIYSRIMQGTPMVVILMLFYYIIFGSVDLSGTVVAIIAFGLNAGAYLAIVFRGAIEGIDIGQTEAALALGFTKGQAFRGVVLPQAIRGMLPGYFSQLISVMKGTAIVGYIAVSDLTKAGDIIRSATFEAFMPLIAVAVIYFVIACILLSVMKALQKKLSPRRVSQTKKKKADKKGGKTV